MMKRSNIIFSSLVIFSVMALSQEGRSQDAAAENPAVPQQEISVSTEAQAPTAEAAKIDPSLVVDAKSETKAFGSFDQVKQRISIRNPGMVPASVGNLLFTQMEVALLRDARKGLVSRVPTESEIANAQSPDEEAIVPMGPRNISLSGIVYVAQDDWTIWINEMQVRPNSIPPEVYDLKVQKEFIELEWFDAFTNKIFPIRMRPNQTFNLDSRIFLPG